MTDETIEKLRAELEKAKEQLRMPHPVGEVSFTLGALQDENDRLREALEKYADRENWQMSVGEAIFSADGYEQKPWRFAREALK